jgi:uncharacterized protein YwqG
VLGRRPPERPVHRLLGWATTFQEDPTLGCTSRRPRDPSRRLLLALDWDERLRFAYGDLGTLYLTVPRADLRAGRFGRVCAEFQQA